MCGPFNAPKPPVLPPVPATPPPAAVFGQPLTLSGATGYAPGTAAHATSAGNLYVGR
jgi:hypothetical protein